MIRMHQISNNDKADMKMASGAVLLILFIASAIFPFQRSGQCQTRQNPSPMIEKIRLHHRIPKQTVPGTIVSMNFLFATDQPLFIPDSTQKATTIDLLIHFHGAPYIIQYAAFRQEILMAALTINLGSGSSRYESPFRDGKNFEFLIHQCRDSLLQRIPGFHSIHQVFISAFSAGYGAIRGILQNRKNWRLIDGVILLDGLHTDYVPDGTLIADGGHLNIEKLIPFVSFAEEAVSGSKRMLVTHSAIFPGTYASTTECTQYIIESLGLQRIPVLRWGPLGMQQLAECRRTKFAIWTFAGNTAPDHIDHLHAFFYFLNRFLKW